ncbi:Membrane bound c-di-GMP receptor LapD [hydrothermal vent metagenome]|uniref:Membrane bound c-di-GMP receptor LapD n=1 Tax=hydrothermal vent metagenome TaxID=652676 RepID=A0A3B1CQ02_9ZZZZ
MTLSRQLIIIISILFLLVFLGTLGISVNNIRSYMVTQLQSHAQDTATSLGLSIKPHLAKNDIPMIDTMVNAIFDSGYYRQISVKRADGETLVNRELEVKIESVPGWFVSLIPLDTPKRESLVTMGWKQGAIVTVQSHPGYAYGEMWRNMVETGKWFFVTLVASLTLMVILMKIVLHPLRKVEKQALAISEGEFPILKKIPRTRELSQVVIAMNKMSGKVERMLTERADLAEKMRKDAFMDPVTNLGNRRSFDMQLEHMVNAKEEIAYGALFIIRITDFADYNDKHGYSSGDEVLQVVADMIGQKSEKFKNASVARIAGAEFAITVYDIPQEEAEELGKELGQGLGLFKFEGMERGVGHIGIGYYQLDLTLAQLLAEADMALRQAQTKGPNAWHLYTSKSLDKERTIGAQEWKRVIQNVLDSRGVSFLYQPVKTLDGADQLHYEALARIQGESGALIPAAVFMPMVERLDMTSAVDRLLVESVVERVSSGMSSGINSGMNISINLFSASINDPEFVDWLVSTLKPSRDVAARLVFEISEHGAIMDTDRFKEISKRLRQEGIKLAIDNFGASSATFGYLRGLKMEYIKIDGRYVLNIDKNNDNQFFVQAITDIAHGLDMPVYAKSVESDKALEALKKIKIDGAQGYFIGRPQEIEEA